ncbi:MAG: endonuclease III [Patescibacteria group bacterium]
MMQKASSRKLLTTQQRADHVWRALSKLFPKAGMILHYGNSWELVIAVQLSAQCTDKKVNEVTAKLFQEYRTLDDYCNASARAFEKAIFSTGFYKQKAKNILAAAHMVRDVFGGVVPSTMEDILKLPGVARKTANVVLGNAYGVVEGIAVDTHVKRLARRWRLTKRSDPVHIERDLMKLFPRARWFNLTYKIIDYGRAYCQAKKHNHAACPLADLG